MDFSQYVPVLCQTEGAFFGKSYWEKISNVISHKGKSVDRPMTKSEFSEGDEVVVHFRGRDYTGVVKSGDGDITTRRSPSPDPKRAASGELATRTACTRHADNREPTTESPSRSTAVPKIHSRTPTKKRRIATRKRGQCIRTCIYL